MCIRDSLRIFFNKKYCAAPGRGIENVLFKDTVSYTHLMTVDCGDKNQVRNVPESNAVNAASRLFIIFPVEAYFDIEKPSFLNILYPDIFKKNITDLVLVTAIHCHATLINRVILVMFQNVDVAESQIFYYFSRR